jgi:hypothetical protein
MRLAFMALFLRHTAHARSTSLSQAQANVGYRRGHLPLLTDTACRKAICQFVSIASPTKAAAHGLCIRCKNISKIKIQPK